MSRFEYTDPDGDLIEVWAGIRGEGITVREGGNERRALLPTGPAQRLAMAEAIVGGTLIEVGDLPEVIELRDVEGQGWRAFFTDSGVGPVTFAADAIEARARGRHYLALARAIEAREKAGAKAQAAEDAKVERVAKALRQAFGDQGGATARDFARAAIAAMEADQ